MNCKENNEDAEWTEEERKSANRFIGFAFLGICLWTIFLLFTVAPSCPDQTPENCFLQGKYFINEGNYIQAQKYFTKAIQKKPDYFEAYIERANSCEKQDSFTLAIKDYTYLLSFPKMTVDKKAELLYKRGRLYYKTLQDSLACKDWNESCENNLPKACKEYRENCKK